MMSDQGLHKRNIRDQTTIMGNSHWKQKHKDCFISTDTGKSLSEALIFASINPQYDDRLFIELRFNT